MKHHARSRQPSVGLVRLRLAQPLLRPPGRCPYAPICSAASSFSQLAERDAEHDDAVVLDVYPERSATSQQPCGGWLPDLQHLDHVAGEAAGLMPPSSDCPVPPVILLANRLRPHECDLKIALPIRLSPCERTQDNDAHRSRIEPGSEGAERVQDGLASTCTRCRCSYDWRPTRLPR